MLGVYLSDDCEEADPSYEPADQAVEDAQGYFEAGDEGY